MNTKDNIQVTKQSIAADMIQYLRQELIEGPIQPAELLSTILAQSSIGKRGAGLALAHHLSTRYDIPIGRLTKESPQKYSFREAVDQVYTLANKTRVAGGNAA